MALGSLLIGALIPWTVNTYAPEAVEKAIAVPVIEISGGLDAAALADGWRMAIPREVSASDTPKTVDSCDALRRWLTQEEAADVETTSLLVSFRGTRIDPVTVTGIRVVVDEKLDPLTGASFNCPSAGARDSEQELILLDEQNPVLRERNSDGNPGGPWFRTHTLTLEQDEVVSFAVEALAYKASYSWHLEAVVRSAGEPVTVRIPGIFRTTAATGSYGASWSWDWSQKPQRLVPSLES